VALEVGPMSGPGPAGAKLRVVAIATDGGRARR
jgi:hypothetical protein